MKNQNKFGVSYRIGFSGLMPDNSISLPQLMSHVQEASLFHTLSIPGGFDYYDKMSWVWILTHWQVEIKSYPKVGDKIIVETWPVRFKSYFGERSFEARNTQGDVLLIANSNWILLDRKTFKPVRPTEEMCEKYGGCFPFPMQKDFALPKAEGYEALCEHSYTPTRRDIDTNDHVNNVKYLEWLYCHIPEEIYNSHHVRKLKVAYKKETLLGDELKIKILNAKTVGASDVEIFAIVEKDGQAATEIYTVWTRNGE